jgi:hypothetical protein
MKLVLAAVVEVLTRVAQEALVEVVLAEIVLK